MDFSNMNDSDLQSEYERLSSEVSREVYCTFVQYNAKDSELVYKLDQSMRLLELIGTMAYFTKCNFGDVFGPVKTWDVLIYNYLYDRKIAVPPYTRKMGGEFEGAWVKDPAVGMHGWTMSFDFASLYPTIIRQWNMSPETLVKQESVTVQNVVQGTGTEWFFFAKTIKCSVAANGTMYRKDKEGVLPQLMKMLMDGRKIAKKEMLKLEQEYETTKGELRRRGIT